MTRFQRKAQLATLSALLLINTAIAQVVHHHDDHGDHPCSVHRTQKQWVQPAESRQSWYNTYDVGFYFLDLNVTSQSTAVSGRVDVHARVTTASLDTFKLELESYLTVDSVKINGQTRLYQHNGAILSIPLNPQVTGGSSLIVSVYYHGQPQISGFFSGITSSYSNTWGKRVTWTLSEPFNARQWWPCKQDLKDKADSAWIFLTTDTSQKAGSNGLLTQVVPLAGGKKRQEWKTTYPIAYYLISFAVADYMDYSIYAHPQGYADSILIQNYIYDHPNILSTYKNAIDQTAGMVTLFSDLMGLYPFHREKYGHCQAQLGGGMEHQTMSTMGDFNTRLIAHELAHQWYGDNVTCATWSDIWINEGFATYGEYLVLEYLSGLSAAASMMQSLHNSIMSSPGGSVYVPPAQVYPGNEYRIFNGRLSYNKGAALLHMLRWELQSDSLFFDILRTFQVQYADSVATGDDFLGVVNAVSGQNFTWFFDQWYYGEGYPTFNIVWNQKQDSLIFTSTQLSSTAVTPFFRSTMEYRILTTAGDTLIRVSQLTPVQSYAIPVNGTVIGMIVDPYNHIVDMPGSIQVSVPETQAWNRFEVYPNPASGAFRVILESNTNHVQSAEYLLRDMSGRNVRQGILHDNQQLIQTQGLDAGMYFLEVRQGMNQGVKKVMLQ